jgi:hypothetical protein
MAVRRNREDCTNVVFFGEGVGKAQVLVRGKRIHGDEGVGQGTADCPGVAIRENEFVTEGLDSFGSPNLHGAAGDEPNGIMFHGLRSA